ncbi:MAG TPA: ABC transporter permease [Thermodesulfobacteriota bacterium]|jgi:lipooligosaccharide transport system permease protein
MIAKGILPNITYRCCWVWYRNLIVWTKFYKSSIVANLGEPVLVLLALGYGFSPLISEVNGMSYMQFLAPGLIAYTAMNAATYECTFGAYARMTAQKTYNAIISTPVEIDEVVAGEVLYGTTKAFFASLAMMVVLSLFKLVPAFTALLVPFVVLITGFVFSSLAMLFTSFTQSWDYFSYYFTLLITPLYFLSGIFFPLSTMPEWVTDIAWFNPLYHSVELSRALIMGNLKPDIIKDALWLLIFGSFVFVYAVMRIRKRIIV